MDEGDVISQSLHSAVFHYKKNNYGRAFAHFLLLFELDSDFCHLYRDEFVYTLKEWGVELEKKNRLTDLCKCYGDGMMYLPFDLDIIKNYSVHLVKMDSSDGGNRFTHFVLSMSEKGLLFEKLLQSIKLDLVSRWHFRMVNDYERNMAYYKSLLSFSSEKPVKVLDIGTGTGLLSLFASNSPNVGEIYAIESEEMLANIARNVFRDNYTKNVHILNKRSSELSEDDINGRADLLVTEIFDAALFGEHCLITLEHAWRELLNENAKVIPQSAEVFIVGIQCEELARNHTVFQRVSLLKDVLIISKSDEPYDAENLKMLKWKPITKTIKILDVDFCSPSQISSLLQGEKNNLMLECISSSKIDAFAVWFNLRLDDTIVITTNPTIDNVKCWEQAIFSPDFPRFYEKGETVSLELSCAKNVLTLEYLERRISPEHFCVTPEIVTYLNDTLIISVMESFAKQYCKTSIKILDYSPFPLFGLLLAIHDSTCDYIYQDDNHCSLINHIININNIPSDKVNSIQRPANEFDYKELPKYNIILFNVIASNGTLDANIFSLLRHCNMMWNTKQQVFPQGIKLVCEVIESEYLPYCSRANDDNSFAFKIANHLNLFAIQEHWMVDKSLPHRKLTDVLKLDILRDDSESLMSEHLLPVLQKGRTDAVLYWFELCYGDNLKVSTFESTHYNVACFLLHKNDVICASDYIKLSVKQHGGHLKIFFNCQ